MTTKISTLNALNRKAVYPTPPLPLRTCNNFVACPHLSFPLNAICRPGGSPRQAPSQKCRHSNPAAAPLVQNFHGGETGAEEDEIQEEADEKKMPSYIADMFSDDSPSDPIDYADDMTFDDDPPGHKSGFVAIIGRPNAGKSTLLNSILGQQLSVVTPKAQTTRHRILGIWSEAAHQAVFLDTPGIIADRRDELEVRMMGAVASSVREADALLAIIDASKRPRQALEMIQPGNEWAGPPMAVLLNKADLLESGALKELTTWFQEHCRAEIVIPISALQDGNLEAVKDWVVSQIPEGPALYPKDFVAEASERFFVAEIIRGQIFQQYREELPYMVAVEVVEFKERRAPAKALVRAHVLVEKKRHVGILLGAGGQSIKALSTAARQEVEEFLQREVYLDIPVKVSPGWRSDAAALERLGH